MSDLKKRIYAAAFQLFGSLWFVYRNIDQSNREEQSSSLILSYKLKITEQYSQEWSGVDENKVLKRLNQ
jgi:hypothetical protein